MFLPLLFVGAESAGGAEVDSAGVSAGDVGSAIAAVSAAFMFRQNGNRRSARVSCSPPHNSVSASHDAPISAPRAVGEAVTTPPCGKRDYIASFFNSTKLSDVYVQYPGASSWSDWKNGLEQVTADGSCYSNLNTLSINDGTEFRRVICQPDGNCLLRCLSIAVNHDRGEGHHSLRQRMVDEMRHSSNKYMGFMTYDSDDGDSDDGQSIASYKTRCSRMEKSEEYVEHIEIYALSNVLQRTFHIFDADKKIVKTVSNDTSLGQPLGRPITLLLSNSASETQCHYDLLVGESEQEWEKFYSSYYTSDFYKIAKELSSVSVCFCYATRPLCHQI